MPDLSSPLIIGAVIPTYGHVKALRKVAEACAKAGLPVLIIDDGNTSEIADMIAEHADPEQGTEVLKRTENGGKGAAVKTGFREAFARDWTHALQLDADGQHDTNDLTAMIELAKSRPNDVICGVPIYDETIPKARKFGREITHFWVRVETLSMEISDSMCGFRIYPLSDTIAVLDREFIGNRMDFDTELLVHLNWRGLRVTEHPTRVIYPEENSSNFRMLWDNVRITLMHTRLAIQAPVRVPIRMWKRRNA